MCVNQKCTAYSGTGEIELRSKRIQAQHFQFKLFHYNFRLTFATFLLPFGATPTLWQWFGETFVNYSTVAFMSML